MNAAERWASLVIPPEESVPEVVASPCKAERLEVQEIVFDGGPMAGKHTLLFATQDTVTVKGSRYMRCPTGARYHGRCVFVWVKPVKPEDQQQDDGDDVPF